MTLAEAAAGIRRIVDMRMADEVRVFAARRGVDLSEFALLPFGGAGAVHAAAVAEELGMRRIVVPARPGAFSALGLLCTDVLHDYIRSELGALDRLDPAHAEQLFREIEAKAASELAEEGLDPSAAPFERDLDMRYAGQGYELRVPLSGLWQGALDDRALKAVRERFDEVHAKIHGHAAKEKSRRSRQLSPARARRCAEISAATIAGRCCVIAATGFDQGHAARIRSMPARRSTRPFMIVTSCPSVSTFAGPAIVEQFDATTVVPPGWHAFVDRHGNLILERKD